MCPDPLGLPRFGGGDPRTDNGYKGREEKGMGRKRKGREGEGHFSTSSCGENFH